MNVLYFAPQTVLCDAVFCVMQIIEADFVDGDDDTVLLTVAISRYGHLRKPKPKPQPAPKVTKPVTKPSPPPPPPVKKAAPAKPLSKPPSRRPSKPPTPPPEPEPEPVPEKDPDPYFVTEDYPVRCLITYHKLVYVYDYMLVIYA